MRYLEPLLWLCALAVLYFMEPSAGPSLCVFKFAGFNSCPGCGIGHAMHDALHGQFRASFREHLMGVPATAVLVVHVVKSIFQLNKNHTNKDEPANAYDAAGSGA